MRRTFTTSVLIALHVLTGGVVFHSLDTPRFAIQRIGEAIETRDAPLLEKHVDIDAVIDAAVDAMPRPAGDPAGSAASPRAPEAERVALVRDAVLSAFLTGQTPVRDAIEIEEIQRSGDVARATVRLRRPPPDTAMHFDLALEKRADAWVVVEVVNLADHLAP